MAKMNIPHINVRKVRLRHNFSWQGLQFFLYTHLGSSLSCKLPIYNIACYLHMCVGQRGGGHGRITEYAGHIIHQSTWHTVFGGERWKIWQKWQYSSVLQYTRRGSAASMKAQWARAAPALLLLCIRTASAPLTLCLRVRCETGVTLWWL